MPDVEQVRGRPHDAKAAQAAILDAAEAAFADHGFAGARIDAIAADAGYNKSLIFHYFGDKLGLYEAVLHQAERQGDQMQEEALGPLLRDPSITSDARRFKSLLEAGVRMFFNFLDARPRLRRIFAWEQAEGWPTMKTIWSRFDHSDDERFIAMLGEAERAGVLRPGVSASLFFNFVWGSCMAYLSMRPFLETMTGEDLSTPASLAQAREQIVEFVVRGTMADSSVPNFERPNTLKRDDRSRTPKLTN